MRPYSWPTASSVVAVVPVAGPLVLVAAISGNLAVPLLIVVAIAAAAAVLLRPIDPVRGPAIASLPLVAGLGAAAAAAPAGPATEALAGLAAVGLLAWLALSDRTTARLAPALSGLLLPGLALGVALAVSSLLPAARQSVGVAALLPVGALALLGYSLLRAGPETAAEAFPPSL